MGAEGSGRPPPAGNQLAGVTQWLVSASGEPGRSFSITTSKLRMNMMTAPSSFFTGTTSTRHRKHEAEQRDGEVRGGRGGLFPGAPPVP